MKVRYFLSVPTETSRLLRLAVKAVIASSTVIRVSCFAGWGAGAAFENVRPRIGRFPLGDDGPGLLPIGLAGKFALELSRERAGRKNLARAAFPALPALLEFPGAPILRMTGFALTPVPAIEVQHNFNATPRLPGIAR